MYEKVQGLNYNNIFQLQIRTKKIPQTSFTLKPVGLSLYLIIYIRTYMPEKPAMNFYGN